MTIRRPVLAAVVSTMLCGLTLSGCGSSDSPYPSKYDPSWLHQQEQHLLDVRAQAVRTGNLKRFLSVLDKSKRGLVRRERRYFADVDQLPLQRFSYKVTWRSWPSPLKAHAWGAHAQVPRVDLTTELDGFDQHPWTEDTGFGFAYRHGVLKIVGDRTRAGVLFPGTDPQPWDLAPIHVVRRGNVLGVFDNHTLSDAQTLLGMVSQGVAQDQQAFPFGWTGHVVFYSFENKALLDSLTNVPGGDIGQLGALTFPVHRSPENNAVAGMRFIVLPSSLQAGQSFLSHIIRHELTHVAVGTRDDGAPTWFAEGLAEYVASRPLPQSQRRIAAVAVTDARGPVGGMPASATFNGPQQDWHYALAWMACDWIAATHGEAALWDLMDTFHNGGAGTPDDRQDQVLEEVIGINSHQLAERAAARIRRLYG